MTRPTLRSTLASSAILAASLWGAGCSDDVPFFFPNTDVFPDTAGDVGTDAEIDGSTDTSTDAGDDTGGEDTGGEDTGGEDTGGEDTGCPDDDGDGVCNADDICPDGDDGFDSDLDGVPDACDVCPDGDDSLDSDSDGVPDDCDICMDGDDNFDGDFDGVPDDCDICLEGSDFDDADLDGVPDACDLCEGESDSDDSDFDGVPDGCDICPDGDDSTDSDSDGVPDACDLCEGPDDECESGCSDAAVAQELFGRRVYGCAGSVEWEDAATLCGRGYMVASAELWVEARGRSVPTYNYWTSDDLGWGSGDGGGDCSVGPAGEFPHVGGCSAGPMRICAAVEEDLRGRDVADPLGNSCTWVGCGWLENEPNQYFGGCSPNVEGGPEGGLAGALCVPAL